MGDKGKMTPMQKKKFEKETTANWYRHKTVFDA